MKVKLDRDKQHATYRLESGLRVPSTTTCLGVLNKPALIQWAWNQGKAGIDLAKSRQQVFDIGTIAHFLCECHIKGDEPDTSDFSPVDVARAETCAIKFMSWWDKEGYTLIACELPLVSEIYRYGGTCDILAKDKKGVPGLIDLKTSKGIWVENYYQIASYRNLAIENKIVEDLKWHGICRIGKDEDSGDFEWKTKDNLDMEFEIFLTCLKLYNLTKRSK